MMDVEKAFDSLEVFNFSFEKTWIWSKLYLVNRNNFENQELCVINGGTTTKYFKLNRGARQGYLISAYLFTLTLEILFLLIKQNPRVKKSNIFCHCYLYSQP